MNKANKIQITNMSSVGIIFRAANPGEIFIEMKDDGHPIKLVRRQLCPIGGNWIGKGAKDDGNPLETFKRELREEMSFGRPPRDSKELALMGMSAGVEHFEASPQRSVEVTNEDKENLEYVKRTILVSVTPFGDFLNTVSKTALDAADPDNKRDSFTTLTSYWAVPLDEIDWEMLLALQNKFENLSNESVTLVTSLDKIIKEGTKTAFAHDRVLQSFFLMRGLPAALELPLVPDLQSVWMGSTLPTYEAYLERFEVTKKPV